MIGDRERLERTFELFEMPEPALERLGRRRDGRRRRERIAAGLLALALVAAGGAIVGAMAGRQPVPSAPPGYRITHAGFIPSLTYTVPRGPAWDYQETFWLSGDLHIGGSARHARIWVARDPERASSTCARSSAPLSSAGAFIGWVEDHPALVVEEGVATQVGGLSGWRVDLTLEPQRAPDCTDGVPLLAVPTWRYPFHGLSLEPDVRARVYALDVPPGEGGGVVTIAVTHRAGDPEAGFAEATRVIETFDFLIDG